jgi:hypothetical protein
MTDHAPGVRAKFAGSLPADTACPPDLCLGGLSLPCGLVGRILMKTILLWGFLASAVGAAEVPLRLSNVMPPWKDVAVPRDLPITVFPAVEHRGSPVDSILPSIWKVANRLEFRAGQVVAVQGTHPSRVPLPDVLCSVTNGSGGEWIGTGQGLFEVRSDPSIPIRHEHYGLGGPLATRITGLAVDSKGVLWVGTPLGLSLRAAGGDWTHIRGRDGLPVEEVTALAMGPQDNLWIGTTKGAILHRPYAEGRRWWYRQGWRYLPGDRVRSIQLAPGGMPAYFLTDQGVGKIEAVEIRLEEKARVIEARLNERHRRLGLVADCVLDDAHRPQNCLIEDDDNDGLWTAYHVTAMALCFGATGEEGARSSARQSMHALYRLQNISGKPGLVARSIVPAEIGRTKSPQWRPTLDGAFYWKSDTSSDEIDGHYLAFHAYFEHIARHDPLERELCVRQVRAVTDYIVDNNYQLIDWNGKRTRWGFWNPESLNGAPEDYLENGLNSLQILSFLKVAHSITGDSKYSQHYQKLIHEHGYLNNVLLSKKVFPDEENHSDNQLGFVAWYPILQLEKDPRYRAALLQAARRHYTIVRREKASFYTFVYGSVDPGFVDLRGAIENLQQIPTDRRTWRQENSHRADLGFSSRRNRFGHRVLLEALPVDERCFKKWNADPFLPDAGGDGRLEDDGAAFLLPYWMGRFHRLIAEAETKP